MAARIRIVVVFGLLLIVATTEPVDDNTCISTCSKDLTRVECACGPVVVDATVRLIRKTIGHHIGPDQTSRKEFFLFLRYFAYAESRFGSDCSFCSAGSEDGEYGATCASSSDCTGGIWGVNVHMLMETQQSQHRNHALFKTISNMLNISWESVQMEKLLKPLYSGLAVAIYYRVVLQVQTPVSNLGIAQQAEYWATNFLQQDKDRQVFEDRIMELKMKTSKECYIRGMDLYFLLDSSLSVGRHHFMKIKEFVSDVVEKFEIGPEGTQVGIITFSDKAVLSFQLDEYDNIEDLRSGIANISYMRGNTATGDALSLLVSDGFTQEKGARDQALGFRRVAIVITDGKSNEGEQDVKDVAPMLSNITVIAIGVTNNVDEVELILIASSNVYTLEDFEFSFLSAVLTDDLLCQVSSVLTEGALVEIDINGTKYSHFTINTTSEGVTVHLNVKSGAVIVYISCEMQPSEGFTEQCLATDNRTSEFVICSKESDSNRRQEDGNDGTKTAFITTKTLMENNSFSLSVVSGDQTFPQTPSGPPQSISVIAIDHQSFRAEWDPPKIYHQNGDILQYVVSVTTVDSGETVVFNSTETNLLVNNLRSSAKYSTAVSAVNADGMGPFSDPSTVETHDRTIPSWSIVTLLFVGLLLVMTGIVAVYLKCIRMQHRAVTKP